MSKFINIGHVTINKNHIALTSEGIYDDDDNDGKFVVISLLGKTGENIVVDKKGVYAQGLSGRYTLHELEIDMDEFISWFYRALDNKSDPFIEFLNLAPSK